MGVTQWFLTSVASLEWVFPSVPSLTRMAPWSKPTASHLHIPTVPLESSSLANRSRVTGWVTGCLRPYLALPAWCHGRDLDPTPEPVAAMRDVWGEGGKRKRKSLRSLHPSEPREKVRPSVQQSQVQGQSEVAPATEGDGDPVPFARVHRHSQVQSQVPVRVQSQVQSHVQSQVQHLEAIAE